MSFHDHYTYLVSHVPPRSTGATTLLLPSGSTVAIACCGIADGIVVSVRCADDIELSFALTRAQSASKRLLLLPWPRPGGQVNALYVGGVEATTGALCVAAVYGGMLLRWKVPIAEIMAGAPCEPCACEALAIAPRVRGESRVARTAAALFDVHTGDGSVAACLGFADGTIRLVVLPPFPAAADNSATTVAVLRARTATAIRDDGEDVQVSRPSFSSRLARPAGFIGRALSTVLGVHWGGPPNDDEDVTDDDDSDDGDAVVPRTDNGIGGMARDTIVGLAGWCIRDHATPTSTTSPAAPLIVASISSSGRVQLFSLAPSSAPVPNYSMIYSLTLIRSWNMEIAQHDVGHHDITFARGCIVALTSTRSSQVHLLVSMARSTASSSCEAWSAWATLHLKPGSDGNVEATGVDVQPLLACDVHQPCRALLCDAALNTSHAHVASVQTLWRALDNSGATCGCAFVGTHTSRTAHRGGRFVLDYMAMGGECSDPSHATAATLGAAAVDSVVPFELLLPSASIDFAQAAEGTRLADARVDGEPTGRAAVGNDRKRPRSDNHGVHWSSVDALLARAFLRYNVTRMLSCSSSDNEVTDDKGEAHFRPTVTDVLRALVAYPRVVADAVLATATSTRVPLVSATQQHVAASSSSAAAIGLLQTAPGGVSDFEAERRADAERAAQHAHAAATLVASQPASSWLLDADFRPSRDDIASPRLMSIIANAAAVAGSWISEVAVGRLDGSGTAAAEWCARIHSHAASWQLLRRLVRNEVSAATYGAPPFLLLKQNSSQDGVRKPALLLTCLPNSQGVTDTAQWNLLNSTALSAQRYPVHGSPTLASVSVLPHTDFVRELHRAVAAAATELPLPAATDDLSDGVVSHAVSSFISDAIVENSARMKTSATCRQPWLSSIVRQTLRRALKIHFSGKYNADAGAALLGLLPTPVSAFLIAAAEADAADPSGETAASNCDAAQSALAATFQHSGAVRPLVPKSVLRHAIGLVQSRMYALVEASVAAAAMTRVGATPNASQARTCKCGYESLSTLVRRGVLPEGAASERCTCSTTPSTRQSVDVPAALVSQWISSPEVINSLLRLVFKPHRACAPGCVVIPATSLDSPNSGLADLGAAAAPLAALVLAIIEAGIDDGQATVDVLLHDALTANANEARRQVEGLAHWLANTRLNPHPVVAVDVPEHHRLRDALNHSRITNSPPSPIVAIDTLLMGASMSASVLGEASKRHLIFAIDFVAAFTRDAERRIKFDSLSTSRDRLEAASHVASVAHSIVDHSRRGLLEAANQLQSRGGSDAPSLTAVALCVTQLHPVVLDDIAAFGDCALPALVMARQWRAAGLWATRMLSTHAVNPNATRVAAYSHILGVAHVAEVAAALSPSAVRYGNENDAEATVDSGADGSFLQLSPTEAVSSPTSTPHTPPQHGSLVDVAATLAAFSAFGAGGSVWPAVSVDDSGVGDEGVSVMLSHAALAIGCFSKAMEKFMASVDPVDSSAIAALYALSVASLLDAASMPPSVTVLWYSRAATSAAECPADKWDAVRRLATPLWAKVFTIATMHEAMPTLFTDSALHARPPLTQPQDTTCLFKRRSALARVLGGALPNFELAQIAALSSPHATAVASAGGVDYLDYLIGLLIDSRQFTRLRALATSSGSHGATLVRAALQARTARLRSVPLTRVAVECLGLTSCLGGDGARHAVTTTTTASYACAAECAIALIGVHMSSREHAAAAAVAWEHATALYEALVAYCIVQLDAEAAQRGADLTSSHSAVPHHALADADALHVAGYVSSTRSGATPTAAVLLILEATARLLSLADAAMTALPPGESLFVLPSVTAAVATPSVVTALHVRLALDVVLAQLRLTRRAFAAAESAGARTRSVSVPGLQSRSAQIPLSSRCPPFSRTDVREIQSALCVVGAYKAAWALCDNSAGTWGPEPIAAHMASRWSRGHLLLAEMQETAAIAGHSSAGMGNADDEDAEQGMQGDEWEECVADEGTLRRRLHYLGVQLRVQLSNVKRPDVAIRAHITAARSILTANPAATLPCWLISSLLPVGCVVDIGPLTTRGNASTSLRPCGPYGDAAALAHVYLKAGRVDDAAAVCLALLPPSPEEVSVASFGASDTRTLSASYDVQKLDPTSHPLPYNAIDTVISMLAAGKATDASSHRHAQLTLRLRYHFSQRVATADALVAVDAAQRVALEPHQTSVIVRGNGGSSSYRRR